MKTRKAEALGDVVKDVVSRIKKSGRITREEMEGFWRYAAGRRAASHTKPISIRRARLVVNVDKSPWLYDLTINKKKILGKLSEKLKGEKIKIKDIRFRIGEINP